jgi:hypothetical protein
MNLKTDMTPVFFLELSLNKTDLDFTFIAARFIQRLLPIVRQQLPAEKFTSHAVPSTIRSIEVSTFRERQFDIFF